jgi:hypothetical protein
MADVTEALLHASHVAGWCAWSCSQLHWRAARAGGLQLDGAADAKGDACSGLMSESDLAGLQARAAARRPVVGCCGA